MDSQDPQLTELPVERRQDRRVKLVTQVQCEALERNEFMITRDVSVAGMFLEGRIPLPADAELSLTFRLYPKEPPISCHAKVIYSRFGLGMGVRFLDLTAEAQETLRIFVEEFI